MWQAEGFLLETLQLAVLVNSHPSWDGLFHFSQEGGNERMGGSVPLPPLWLAC